MQKGIIVILNGPSSVGKTTIQKALQNFSDLHFLRLGIDTFFDALIQEPDLALLEKEKKFDQYTRSGEYIRGVEWTVDETDSAVVPLKIGPAGDRIIQGMHRSIAAYAGSGNNLIVDYILYKSSWINDLADVLKDYTVYLIGVHAPLEEIEKRERERGTSPCGHARSHYATVHQGMFYDLEINTVEESPESAAKKISHLIESRRDPDALRRIGDGAPPQMTRIGVYGLVKREMEWLLVIQKTGPYVGKFDFPGGGIEFGESVEKTLHREFLEEISMEFDSMHAVANVTSLEHIPAHQGNAPYIFYRIGLIYTVSGLRLVGKESEGELQSSWVNVEDLCKENCSPFVWEMVRQSL